MKLIAFIDVWLSNISMQNGGLLKSRYFNKNVNITQFNIKDMRLIYYQVVKVFFLFFIDNCNWSPSQP
jgi:hypothetical protein